MNELQESLELIKSGTPDDIINALENIRINDLDDSGIELLTNFIAHEDKGVRNAVSFYLISNFDKRVPPALTKFISSTDITIRNLAGDTLLNLGGKSTIALVSFLYISDNHDDLKFAIDLLGLIGDPGANEKIIDILSSAEDENVIIACLEALGNLKCEDALDYLIMSFEKNDLYKPSVIEALGKIGTKQALEFLNQKYSSEDDFLKFSIIDSLGKIGDEETFFFLLAELNQTEGALIWPLIAAIYNLKEKFGFDIPFDEKMKNAVVQTIFAADPYYKKIAGHLVTIFEDREINLACLKIYGEDYDLDEIIKQKFFNYHKDMLLDITSSIEEKPQNMLSLLLLLQEVIENYQGQGVSVSNLEYRNLIDTLTKCLEYADEEVRKTAMTIFFSIDSNTAMLFIDTMLEDDNIWNRLHLLDILAFISYDITREALDKLSNDDNEMIAERAKSIIEENQNYSTFTEAK